MPDARYVAEVGLVAPFERIGVLEERDERRGLPRGLDDRGTWPRRSSPPAPASTAMTDAVSEIPASNSLLSSPSPTAKAAVTAPTPMLARATTVSA